MPTELIKELADELVPPQFAAQLQSFVNPSALHSSEPMPL